MYYENSLMVVWCSGISVGHVNVEVGLRWARLVLRWTTTTGGQIQVPEIYFGLTSYPDQLRLESLRG